MIHVDRNTEGTEGNRLTISVKKIVTSIPNKLICCMQNKILIIIRYLVEIRNFIYGSSCSRI